VELTAEGITLRPFEERDVSAIARAAQDEDLHRFIPELPFPYTEGDAAAYVTATRSWDERERLARAVVDAASGELLGSIDVRLGEVGSIGYWVAPWARGRGVATSALRALSRWALTSAGVERLELTTHPGNLASQRVAEKAGFQREGTLRSQVRFREGRRDSVIFSLLPEDLTAS